MIINPRLRKARDCFLRAPALMSGTNEIAKIYSDNRKKVLDNERNNAYYSSLRAPRERRAIGPKGPVP